MSSNRITSLAAMVISVFYLFLITMIEKAAFSDPIGPKVFPLLCGGGMLLSGILLFFYDALIEKEAPVRFTSDLSGKGRSFWKSPLAVSTVVCVIYALTFESLGYPVATAIFIFLFMTYLQKQKWVANIIFSISFSAGSFIVFVKLLNLSFPFGILEGFFYY